VSQAQARGRGGVEERVARAYLRLVRAAGFRDEALADARYGPPVPIRALSRESGVPPAAIRALPGAKVEKGYALRSDDPDAEMVRLPATLIKKYMRR